MPVIYSNHIDKNTQIGLWYISENTDYLFKRLSDYPTDLSELCSISNLGRQRSSTAVRLLVHTLLRNKYERIIKDKYGKPYFESKNFNIGLSHSGKVAAAIISSKKCGIDIQISSDKIIRIANKFLHESEITEDIHKLHLIWSAKEAIYKAYGKKRIEFKRELIVELEDLNRKFGSFKGFLKKNNRIIKYNLNYEIWKDYYLVYAIEQ